MSGYKRVNFYELCRLCATNREKKKIHIFREEGRSMRLQAKIQTCLGVKVCETDCLPKVVCSDCLRDLEQSFSVRERCVSSEKMLSSYFDNFCHTEDFKKSGQVYIKDGTAATNPDKTHHHHQSANINVSVNQNGEVIGIVDKTSPHASSNNVTLPAVIPKVPPPPPPPPPSPKVVAVVVTSEKSFRCEVCPKVFKRREHLYQHEKLHSGFRPFVCEHCKKSFMRKEHLHRHMTCHNGEKNFVCHLCFKSFSRNDNLLKHRKTHDRKGSGGGHHAAGAVGIGFPCKSCNEEEEDDKRFLVRGCECAT